MGGPGMADAFSIALGGLNTQQQRFTAAANTIAQAGTGAEVDLAKESVNILTAKTLFKANISVIKTQDQMLGSLLDILA
jgi:flagellar hook protein FlgE